MALIIPAAMTIEKRTHCTSSMCEPIGEKAKHLEYSPRRICECDIIDSRIICGPPHEVRTYKVLKYSTVTAYIRQK